ncbi:hypothetical protein SELMODRAFT_415786 [Selaginella moellendorffii]|uniref:Protein kinase domain-containing protein n=1 Tax=Selaginella moellendorffii TaxID=88036 RepID=D8RX85_SELML|nr:probable leucine-rich repeat receptor-like protein kinase At1g35710 [Selaginella moellendorffii]EFJ23392.1 hypothetical protein SELMODRAFT_415786 [Selaginella moellendorffii]|eukprot:XP_002975763.1 probable leucine-rich repeat receptor-like protein kinase At1g35710 [Selaginella moellendorffii]
MGARLSRLEQPMEFDPKGIELITGCFHKVVTRMRVPSSSDGSNDLIELVVYKGVLGRSEVLVECGKGDFKDRMTALWSPHPNIVRLLGFCTSPFLHALVMPLEKRGCLKGMVLDGSLGWKQRVKIIKGLALALDHLHDARNVLGFQVLHLGVRLENVWVAEDYTPKLAGFHSCKIRRSKKSISGTGSQEDLEIISKQDCEGVTDKMDVLGFGFLVLEITSGRELQSNPEEMIQLADQKLAIERWIDPRIRGVPEMEARRMIQMSMLCLQSNPEARPSMGKLVSLLGL